MEQITTQASRERVKRAIRQLKTDKLPKGELLIDDAAVAKELQCHQVGFEEKVSFVNKFGMDLISLSPQYPFKDNSLPDVRDYVIPDLKDWVLKTDLFTFALLDSVFGWGNKLMGFTQFITLPQRSPASFVDFVEKVEKFNLELASRLLDQGIDGIIIADDIAYNRGLLINPADLRKYIFPSLNALVNKIDQEGIPVFFHSDGNIKDIIPDLVEAGFSGLHCIDEQANMDILKLQSRYGKQLCFWGTLSVEDVSRAKDQEYLQSLEATIHSIAAKGGFILGTNCGIFDGFDTGSLFSIYRRF